jgi:hypothetical protein
VLVGELLRAQSFSTWARMEFEVEGRGPGAASRRARAGRTVAGGVRGLRDHSDPDVARIEREARNRLGEATFAEAVREGTQTNWSEPVEVTLTS